MALQLQVRFTGSSNPEVRHGRAKGPLELLMAVWCWCPLSACGGGGRRARCVCKQ